MPRQTSQVRKTRPTVEPTSRAPEAPDRELLRMTVYFHQEEWNALRDRADEQNTTMANLVRKAVRENLKIK